MSTEIDLLKRALEREKKARKSAEQTLEQKSYELYLANQDLQKTNLNLEVTVETRNKQLQSNEIRFEKIVESASDLIYRSDHIGKCIYANPMTIEKMGYSFEELKVMHFTKFVRKDKIKEVAAFYMTQLKEKRTETYLEFPAVTKTGKTIWLGQYVIYAFDADKRFTGVSTVARDMTEQHELLAVIKSSEEKYRNIISNMNLGLLEVDMNERIIKTNQSFCEMSGYANEELLGQIAPNMVLIGEDSQITKEKNNSRKKGISDTYEIQVKTKAGNIKWWLISGSPLLNDKGVQIGSLGIHLDITKQKKLEIELSLAKNQAESSNHSKEVFLANMSHEIRTPMNGILGMARQLKKSRLNQEQEKYLDAISATSDHLMVILNDILDISKIEAGKLQIEKTTLNISEVAERTKNILFAKAEEKGLGFLVEIDKNISNQLFGDPIRLNQVLINLAGNAVKFTEQGFVSIKCQLLKQENAIQCVQFCIQDSGIGIAEEYLKKIFDKFSQEVKSISRKYGGTGLGMSISKQLVELMGGKLSIESKKNIGTTVSFVIEFELENEKNNPQKKVYKYNPDEIQDRVKGKKILLAEDNEMNQLVVSNSLDYIGITYDIVDNGLKAYEAIQKENYSIILMDINMPIMDGIEATKKIRTELKLKTPIVALTANAMEGANKKYLNAGMDDYLSKPFVEEELFELLCKWIGGGRAASEQEDAQEKTELYNLSKLEKISRNNRAFIDKMLQLFVAKIPPAIEEINTAYQKNDLETVNKTAHRIKPTLNDLNITPAKDLIKQIEKRAFDQNNSPELKQLIDSMSDNVLEAVEAIKKTIS